MSKFVLQNILFKNSFDTNKDINLLFFRSGLPNCVLKSNNISINSILSFDTYYNYFSLEKWLKYTNLENLHLSLEICGECEVELFQDYLEYGGKIVREVILTKKILSKEKKAFDFEFITSSKIGAVSFRIKPINGNVTLFDNCFYYTETKSNLNLINIGIGICTFKREKYIKENIKMLKNTDNKYSELNGIPIFISDNAKTLKLNEKDVYIYKSRNVGGSGGFTNCMVEALKYNSTNHNKITHFILMDDDLKFNSECLFRTINILKILKKEYDDSFVGGAMFRGDNEFIQHASGEKFNGSNCFDWIITHNMNRDMRNNVQVLENEQFYDVNYQAWWYCCIPMKFIRHDNLPLNFFIKGDDIEFSIRNCTNIILLNGINVWHDPFEYKYNSKLEYYAMRNYLITISSHGIHVNVKNLIKKINELCTYFICNYKYIEANYLIDAVHDFLKGPDFFMSIDSEKFHNDILKYNNSLKQFDEPVDIEKYKRDTEYGIKLSAIQKVFRYITLNGLIIPTKDYAILGIWGGKTVQTYKKKYIIFYEKNTNKGFVLKRSFKNAIKCLLKLKETTIKLKRNFNIVRRDYKNFFALNKKTML